MGSCSLARCTGGRGKAEPGRCRQTAQGPSPAPSPTLSQAPSPGEQLRPSPFSPAQWRPSLICSCFSHFPATQTSHSSSGPPSGLGLPLLECSRLFLGGLPKCPLCRKGTWASGASLFPGTPLLLADFCDLLPQHPVISRCVFVVSGPCILQVASKRPSKNELSPRQRSPQVGPAERVPCSAQE